MSLNMVKGNALPIGVDLGSGSLKMAQLRLTDDLELLGAASAPLAGPDCEPAAGAAKTGFQDQIRTAGPLMKQVIKAAGFKTRQCILSMPASASFVQHVKIPKLPAEEVPKALQWELQGKLPFPVEDAVVRHVIAGDVFGDGEPKQEVIIVAAHRDDIDSYLKAARGAGLEPIGISIEACAVVDCFARLFRRASDSARTILYIDIGAATTQIVLSHGNQLVFARNLESGGHQLDQAVADGLKISPQQARALRSASEQTQDSAAQDELYHLLDRPLGALGDELTQCLRYYESVFRNQSVERAIFVGGQAYDKRLCQMLAQRLNLPAQVGDPLVRIRRIEGAGMAIGLDRREPQPDWAVAVGLSIGAAEAA